MAGAMGVPGPGTVAHELNELSGQPLRLTVLDFQSRERVARVFGVLTSVQHDTLVVDCLSPVSVPPSGVPVTVEFWAQGNSLWCHTHTVARSDADGTRLVLKVPETVQTHQRRRFPRVDVDLPVQVEAATGSISAVLRDLSAGGASVQVSEPVGAGERIRLLLNLRGRLFFHEIRAEVLRCTPHSAGQWIAALRFACTLEEETALAEFVERQLSGQAQPG